MKNLLNNKFMRYLSVLILSIGIITGLSIQVQASTIKVSSVKLSKTKDALIVGRTDSLKATISPINATNKAVNWKSSNTKVARVDSKGKITAISAGKATITSTTIDGSKRATCKINVNP